MGNQTTVMESSFHFLGKYICFFTLLISCKNSKQVDGKEFGFEGNNIHCNVPESRAANLVLGRTDAISAKEDTSHSGMVWIEGGSFMMGAPDHKGMANEYPAHEVSVAGFWMDLTEVTNEMFGEFVKATGYITTAEKDIDWEELRKQLPPGTPKPGDIDLKAGSMVFFPTVQAVALDDISQWWKWVPGASWRQPKGPGSSLQGKGQHPVVHISWEDALAYCKWAGKRLPTEAEWEWAASGGGINLYSWGNEEIYNSAANTWQGRFPHIDNKEDGFSGTAPVRSYAPNVYGLYDMSGNVWEWCSDWYDEKYYQELKGKKSDNPAGPAKKEASFFKVIRGGSYLCNPSYCEGYRRSRRMYSSYDSGTSHIGFRTVKN
jgi:formylglycine-generating enzyme